MNQRISPLRKLIDTSFVWKKKDGYYGCIDIMSRIDSAVLTTTAYNLYGNYPEFSISQLKKYLELRRLPNPDGYSLIDESRSCYENVEALVYVRALTKRRWENKEYNKVRIKNLVRKNETFGKKVESFRSLDVNCSCERVNYQTICRPAGYQRVIFKDWRNFRDIPGSFINSVFCKHACIAMDYLVLFYGVEDFEYFGPSLHVIEASKVVIKDFLKFRPRYPDYKLNQFYLRELKRNSINLNEPLMKFIGY